MMQYTQIRILKLRSAYQHPMGRKTTLSKPYLHDILGLFGLG